MLPVGIDLDSVAEPACRRMFKALDDRAAFALARSQAQHRDPPFRCVQTGEGGAGGFGAAVINHEHRKPFGAQKFDDPADGAIVVAAGNDGAGSESHASNSTWPMERASLPSR